MPGYSIPWSGGSSWRQEPIEKTTSSTFTNSLGSISLFCSVRERGACEASLTTGVLGGDRKAPDPLRSKGGSTKRANAGVSQSSAMLVLASRRGTSEMCEESISRNCYVSLSALSGIFCMVGAAYCLHLRLLSCPSFAICEHTSLRAQSFKCKPLTLSFSVTSFGPTDRCGIGRDR
jgi:hypothetical protein